jgi:hypothetical protein
VALRLVPTSWRRPIRFISMRISWRQEVKAAGERPLLSTARRL